MVRRFQPETIAPGGVLNRAALDRLNLAYFQELSAEEYEEACAPFCHAGSRRQEFPEVAALMRPYTVSPLAAGRWREFFTTALPEGEEALRRRPATPEMAESFRKLAEALAQIPEGDAQEIRTLLETPEIAGSVDPEELEKALVLALLGLEDPLDSAKVISLIGTEVTVERLRFLTSESL